MLIIVMRTLAAALVFILSVGSLHADIKGNTFESDQWKVSLELPRNWQATEKTSYPNILLWLVYPNPRARMLLAAEDVLKAMDSQRYAAKTMERLNAMGFKTRTPQLHPATGAYWLDYHNDKRFLRSALLVYQGRGYSLTLAADDPSGRSTLLRAFDSTLRSIRPKRKSLKTQ